MNERCATGVDGLDNILCGGLPRNRLFLIQGNPGVGKTTLALQFLREGLARSEPGLYVTLSETEEELRAVATSHSWDLEGLSMLELSAIEDRLAPEAQNTLLHPSEVELTQTTQLVLDEVNQSKAVRVVLDSLSELQLLAQSRLRYRRQLLALKQFFAKRNCTVLLLDDQTSEGCDSQLHSLAHGVISLEHLRPEFGSDRRRLSVIKMRGSTFRGGYHDFRIGTGGLMVFPRLVAAEHHAKFARETVSSDVPELDALMGGGMHRGTSNLLLGPAGTGKSTVALQYAMAAAQRGEKVAYYAFDESEGLLRARTEDLGLDLSSLIANGKLNLRQVDPAELSPGEFIQQVRHLVEHESARMIVFDSLNGYFQAMPEERFLVTQLHELLTYLGQQGVLTILVLAQHGLVGKMESTVDVTYLADTVVLTRFFESSGLVKKAISVIKKRSGKHEETIRELSIGRGGIRIGAPLSDFHGVLTGTPQYRGPHEAMMGPRDAIH
jgi:circadian clock protein KaiC